MKYSEMKFENISDDGSNADKITAIPKEIWDYYISHKEYEEKKIPLNADTCREIAGILDKEAETK